MSRPPVGDRGQRYLVTFYDPESRERRTLGWSSTLEGANGFAQAIRKHPSWRNPIIDDREEEKPE